MTQLDPINYLSAIFFSLEFFNICLFFMSSIVLFSFLSHKHYFIYKIVTDSAHLYKLRLTWNIIIWI